MSAFYDLSKTPRSILNQAIVRAIVSENNGALFDPSDLSTLFQDAAGTTSVTAVEQPVGLMLDKSRGIMLGPEVVPDPTFSQWTDSSVPNGWTKSGTHNATNYVQQAVGGGIRIISDGTLVSISKSSALEIGQFYKIIFTVTSATNPSASINVDAAETARVSAVGTFGFILKASNSTSLDLKRFGLDGACDMTISSLSIKKLYGYHATQSITASRPTLSARKNILLATETLATQSVTTLAATYTLSFTGAGSVTLSGASTGTLTGNGTDRVSLTFTPTAGTLTLTVSGSVTKAQLELGAVAGPYQRVTTATNYDTDERYFKKYLRFDGVDDYLNLPYMGLYANGSASVVMGVDDRAQTGNSRAFSESSSTTSAQYSLRNTVTTGIDSYVVDDAGTPFIDTLNTKGTESKNYIISVVDTGTNITRYRNSASENAQSYSRAGKTFTANKTTIGALDTLGTIAAYTAMNLSGLIITKSALTDSQRVACERFEARKSGVLM